MAQPHLTNQKAARKKALFKKCQKVQHPHLALAILITYRPKFINKTHPEASNVTAHALTHIKNQYNRL